MSVIGPRELLHYWPYAHTPSYKGHPILRVYRNEKGKMRAKREDASDTALAEVPWPLRLFWGLSFETTDRPNFYHIECPHLHADEGSQKITPSFHDLWTKGYTFTTARSASALLQLRIKGWLMDSWLLQSADVKFIGPASLVFHYGKITRQIIAPPNFQFTVERPSHVGYDYSISCWYYAEIGSSSVSTLVGNLPAMAWQVEPMLAECQKNYQSFFLALCKRPGETYYAPHDTYLI